MLTDEFEEKIWKCLHPAISHNFCARRSTLYKTEKIVIYLKSNVNSGQFEPWFPFFSVTCHPADNQTYDCAVTLMDIFGNEYSRHVNIETFDELEKFVTESIFTRKVYEIDTENTKS